MAKNAASPQVPGAPAPETQVNPEAETITVPKTQMDALMARISSLENAQQQAPARRANPEADLPDAADIDPATIKSPVLSKQGWVVPDKFGSNPAAKNL